MQAIKKYRLPSISKELSDRICETVKFLLARGTVVSSRDLIKFLGLEKGERWLIPVIYKYVNTELRMIIFRQSHRPPRFLWTTRKGSE